MTGNGNRFSRPDARSGYPPGLPWFLAKKDHFFQKTMIEIL
jgi:hypothetical protein